MKLVQLTDLHLTACGTPVGRRDPIRNLRDALDEIAVKHADAELIAITGDLSEGGAEADYRMVRAMTERMPVPVALTIGNHDDRAQFARVFPEHVTEAGHAQSVLDLSSGRAIFLDTADPPRHSGHLDQPRLSWLKERMSEHPGPFYIFMHHNPIPTGLEPLDRIMLQDRGPFCEVVATEAHRIAHIFHGHIHLPMSGSLHGVPVTCPRGTNHAGYPNFGSNELLDFADLPEAYAVCMVDDATISVVMVEFGYQRTRAALPRPTVKSPKVQAS